MSGPSVKRMVEHLGISEDQAKILKKMMNDEISPVVIAEGMGLTKGFYNDPDKVYAIMLVADKFMEGSGVEGLEGEYVDSFSQNVQASYVNTGDTYSATLLYDNVTGRFVLTTWGDFVEGHPRRFPE